MSDDDLFDDDLLEEDLLEATEKALQKSQEEDLIDDDLDFDPDGFAGIRTNTFQRRTEQAHTNLRQTTIFGGIIDDIPDRVPARHPPYRNASAEEAPTHHALDSEALRTWVYPLNLGPVRDYQYAIVSSCLYRNTLVALPTGLGKTFIAATVMLNFHRWTKTGKLIFVTPTKPLAAQQVDACLNVAGIPRSEATLLTGEVSPGLRAQEWETKRVFFMTPQTLQNDLSSGFADPKQIALLVIDEAHRATGSYSFVSVVKLIRRFSSSFRVLALTATPGSSVEAIQNVIDNLGISHIEIRTEDSIDIRKYVHSREVDQQVLDPSSELLQISELFGKALRPLTDKLSGLNIYWGSDPMNLTQYGLIQKQKEWFASAGRRQSTGVQGMVRSIFSVLVKAAVAIKLLNFHGIKPFFDKMAGLRSEPGNAKYRAALVNDSNFQEMMGIIEVWLKEPAFVGHPKLSVLADTVLNHFMDHPTQTSATKIIVFSEFRNSAEVIVRDLNKHRPMVRAKLFVGQADSEQSAGMKQTDQIKAVEDFRGGKFNVLVATCIGEEGLDIGQVDLIVCYDASASPIRMLQRMGRTGRKRAGRIVLLLMRGKEQEKYEEAKAKYAEMQKIICSGDGLEFRHDLSRRIIPRHVAPEVAKCVVEIPVENTQTTDLPMPKNIGAPKKRPPKKFHMPDGVITDFVKASDVGQDGSVKKRGRPKKVSELAEIDDIAEAPPLERVELKAAESKEFKEAYLKVPGHQPYLHMGEHLDANPAHYKSQRVLLRTARVKHGQYTKRIVALLRDLAEQEDIADPPTACPDYQHVSVPDIVDFSDLDEEASLGHRKRKRQCISEGGGQHVETRVQQKRPKKRQSKAKKPLGRLTEEGDECRSDEVIPEHDSDDGEDLRDFIVSDDDWDSPIRHKSTSPTSPSTSKPASAATKSTASPDLSGCDDDEFASLSQLVGSSTKKPLTGTKHTWILDSDNDEDMAAIDATARKTSKTSQRHARSQRIMQGGSDEE